MKKQKYLTVETMVILALMIGMNIILSRWLSIQIGNTIRIGFGSLPVLLAGLWFGPLGGAIVGGLGDILGCLLNPNYGWYPPLTISPVLLGIIPGLLKRTVFKKTTIPAITGTVVISCGITSLITTPLCLMALYNMDYVKLVILRIPQAVITMTALTVLISGIYKSGLPAFIARNLVKPSERERSNGNGIQNRY